MNIIQSIKKFNEGRNPSLLQMKYKTMQADIFRFYRGTCHLFYEDNHSEKVLNDSPLTWLCGDLHLENFGSHKGDNRLVYFDINDFDEALLSPCLWDISRFLTSIIVAHKTTGIKNEEAFDLAGKVLIRYTKTLKEAHSRLIETETAQGVIRDLLEDLKNRKRKDFIEKRTEVVSGKRRLKIDGIKTLAADQELKEKIRSFIDDWALNRGDKDFFRIHDVAIRIAGTGSLGLERYVLLAEGKGTDNNYLLDLKIASPSSLQKYSKTKQPEWNTDSERLIEIQKRMQAVSPALLSEIKRKNKNFVLKELQPSQDKLDLLSLNGKAHKLQSSLESFADIVAWDQLRSSGRQGSSTADELIDFANRTDWQQRLMFFCSSYFEKVKTDYELFCKAFDEGEFSEDEDAELIS
ncbi:MAG: DUF2252 domain-containing protein [Bacteroidia bacterium]